MFSTITEEPSSWPSKVDRTESMEQIVNDILADMPLPTTPISPESITRNPGPYLYWRFKALKKMEAINETRKKNELDPLKVFSLYPCYGFVRQHISIDITGLKQLLRNAGLSRHILSTPDGAEISIHEHNTEQFRRIFRIEKVQGNKTFANLILTDGYATSVTLAKRVGSGMTSIQLDAEDFNEDELNNQFELWGVDPGEKDIFSAANGMGPTRHEQRSFSKKEYYNFAGTMLSRQKMLQYKQEKFHAVGRGETSIVELEALLPTRKTSSLTRLQEYITTCCMILPVLCKRYDARYTALRFLDYQGKQRAQDELVNILINGGKKYSGRRPKTKKTKTRNKRIK